MSALEIDVQNEIENQENIISLNDFIVDFGEGLLEAVNKQNPAIFDGTPNLKRDQIMDRLKRKPFPAQRKTVQAASRLLIDEDVRTVFMNADMGTGKTIMAIALSSILNNEGYKKTLVISPPHLVYKWQREIHETLDNAKVWILNGPDTLAKLILLRKSLGCKDHDGCEFFILGRVRMRMDFHWKPAFSIRKIHTRMNTDINDKKSSSYISTENVACCPSCGVVIKEIDSTGCIRPIKPISFPDKNRMKCSDCNENLWTLMRPGKKKKSQRDIVFDAMCKIPTIGKVTANRLIDIFGEGLLSDYLSDNIYNFINLMDNEGDLVFSDKQARRMESAMASLEFGLGQGGYQATEFIKRYLPYGFFGNLVVDEAHESKGRDSCQGQAMGVLASRSRKICLLSGTFLGGYSDDIFYLLFRTLPEKMIEDGYVYNNRGNLGTASQAFMRDHGVLIDIYSETEGNAHKTSRGTKTSHHIKRGVGFGPGGIARYILPYTVFLKLDEIGGVLPAYNEHFINIEMSEKQSEKYLSMRLILEKELKDSLKKGDKTLMGTVMSSLLRYSDTCFREEIVKHPRTKETIFYAKSIINDGEIMPKEKELINICKKNKLNNRRVLVYSIYTGKHDTTSRLSTILKNKEFKVSVLRATVSTGTREDFILNAVDSGCDVLICNPELVKTGLDLLDFPTIVFMQTGYNTYTLQQASKRSWRIGQTKDVDVYYLGYESTTQISCLELMAKKISISQSTAGSIPSSGLNILNQDGDSLEVALAKQLLSA